MKNWYKPMHKLGTRVKPERVNIKKYYACLFIGLFLFALPAQASEACDNAADYTPIAERTEKTLLYKINAPCNETHAPASYLFGTFHSDSAKLKPLYDKVLSVFDKVDAVALEIVQTPQVQREAQRALSLPVDHKGLKSMLSDDIWQKTVHIIGPLLHFTKGQLNSLKPWGVAVLAQYPAPEADGIVLDMRIQQYAESNHMEVVSLESIVDQFTVFESLSEENQITFLEMTLEDMDEMPAKHARLMRLYLAEDTAGIMQMSDELFAEMAAYNATIANHLKTHLIDNRNKHMAKRMIQQMRKNPTLFAIGALHLPGEAGVISLLEKQGYRFYPVTN